VRNMADERKKSPRRRAKDLKSLTEDQITAWADKHYERTGHWPGQTSGPIVDAPGETWAGINHALERGRRGFIVGSSLAKLLEATFGVLNVGNRPPLATEMILKWADAYHSRTNKWPNLESGQIADAPGETWSAVNGALAQGNRGLPGGSTLARLLQKERRVRNSKNLSPLTEDQILLWATKHRERKGKWPTLSSGCVIEEPSEKWININQALRKGLRGLPGGQSLSHVIKDRGL
jgi:hypothetical protein